MKLKKNNTHMCFSRFTQSLALNIPKFKFMANFAPTSENLLRNVSW